MNFRNVLKKKSYRYRKNLTIAIMVIGIGLISILSLIGVKIVIGAYNNTKVVMNNNDAKRIEKRLLDAYNNGISSNTSFSDVKNEIESINNQFVDFKVYIQDSEVVLYNIITNQTKIILNLSNLE